MSSELFASTVKNALQGKGISYRKFGRLIGVSHSYISQVLTGKLAPSASFIVKTSSVIGIPPDNLLRIAGVIPENAMLPNILDKETAKEVIELFSNLPPEKRAEALRYLRFLSQSQ